MFKLNASKLVCIQGCTLDPFSANRSEDTLTGMFSLYRVENGTHKTMRKAEPVRLDKLENIEKSIDHILGKFERKGFDAAFIGFLK